MTLNLAKGQVEDFASASKDGTGLTLLKKDFSKVTLKNINIQASSMISNCLFAESNFFSCTFKDVNFVRCDFSKADMYAVNFINCQFNECSFNEVKFNMVVLDEECIVNNCTFAGVGIEAQSGVSGIDPLNFKVIVDNKASSMNFSHIGLIQEGEGCFKIEEGEGDDKVVSTVSWDPELMGGQYRNIIFIGNNVIKTFDIQHNVNKMSEENLKSLLKLNLLEVVDDMQNDNQKKNLETLISKI